MGFLEQISPAIFMSAMARLVGDRLVGGPQTREPHRENSDSWSWWAGHGATAPRFSEIFVEIFWMKCWGVDVGI